MDSPRDCVEGFELVHPRTASGLAIYIVLHLDLKTLAIWPSQ